MRRLSGLHRGLGGLVVAALLPAGCLGGGGGTAIGVPVRERSQFGAEWRQYLKLADFKSLAVAGDLEGVYASGFVHGSAQSQLAVDEALEHCELRRIDRQIEDPCRTYAIGDERVEPSE